MVIQFDAAARVRETVSTVIAQVLGRPQLALDENIFLLGGSSLAAALISSQLESILGIGVPISLLYDKPVVGELAEELLKSLAQTPPPACAGSHAQEPFMHTLYNAALYAFDQPVEHRRITLAEVARRIRDGEAAAALVDVVEPSQLGKWWDDDAYPAVTQHQSFPGAGKSGLAIGPTQRLVKEQLIPGLIDYFSYGARCNEALRKTEFVRFCERELGAGSVRVGDWGELPLVSKREYQPIQGGAYSVPPHCDAIHFGREAEKWPIKEGYEEGHDQISVFLSVQDAENGAGLVLWDYRAKSRPELDEMMAEQARTGRIERLLEAATMTIRGRPGQLNILNTRMMHAVEQCETVRRTLGSFIVWHDGQWRMFH